MRHIAAVFVALLMGAFFGPAHAYYDVQSIQVTGAVVSSTTNCLTGLVGARFSTKAYVQQAIEACAPAGGDARTSPTPVRIWCGVGKYSLDSDTASTYQIRKTSREPAQVEGACGSTVAAGLRTSVVANSCPTGQELIDGRCRPICPPPQTRDFASGECVCPEGTELVEGQCVNVCSIPAGQKAGLTGDDVQPGQSEACVNGCKAHRELIITVIADATKERSSVDQWTSTGEFCESGSPSVSAGATVAVDGNIRADQAGDGKAKIFCNPCDKDVDPVQVDAAYRKTMVNTAPSSIVQQKNADNVVPEYRQTGPDSYTIIYHTPPGGTYHVGGPQSFNTSNVYNYTYVVMQSGGSGGGGGGGDGGGGGGDGGGDDDGDGECDPQTETCEGEGGGDCDPETEECSDDSIAGGTDCAAPPACDGNPIECYLAKQAWTQACVFKKPTAAEIRETIQQGFGSTERGGLLQKAGDDIDVAKWFDDAAATGEGRCLSDVSIDLAPVGDTITLPLSQFCDVLSLVRVMFLIAVAFFCLRIVAEGW